MYRISIAAMALVAFGSFAFAEQLDRGDMNSERSNSAAEHTPGQMKEGGSAKDLAPNQMKEGTSAKEESHDKSASERYEKNPPDKSSHAGGLKNERDRSAKTESDRNAKNQSAESSGRNDRLHESDRNRPEQSSTEKRPSASTGASEGTGGKDQSLERSDRNDRLHGNVKTERANTGGKASSSKGASEGAEGHAAPGKGAITGVTEEQRTRVKSVFTEHRVEPAKDLGVSVKVGVALPHSVHLYSVPTEVVAIVPAYRGFDYIMLDDNRIAIVDPSSFEVVDIIVVA